MYDLYIKIQQILKINKVIFSKIIADDLIQECICCLLENFNKNKNEQNKLIVSCARHFIYEYNKSARLVDINNLSIDDEIYLISSNLDTQAITKIPAVKKSKSEIIKPDGVTLRQLVDSKGDYTISELAGLIKITRSYLSNALIINKLGIKSTMRLKLVKYFNKQEIVSNILTTLHTNEISKNILPISSSSYYNGLHHGFSYTQARKIAIWLKNHYNITGVLDDIY